MGERSEVGALEVQQIMHPSKVQHCLSTLGRSPHILHYATVLSRWASVARSVPSKLQQKKCTYARKFHFYCHMRHFFLNIQPKAVIILDFLRLSAIGREVLAVMGLDIKLV